MFRKQGLERAADYLRLIGEALEPKNAHISGCDYLEYDCEHDYANVTVGARIREISAQIVADAAFNAAAVTKHANGMRSVLVEAEDGNSVTSYRLTVQPWNRGFGVAVERREFDAVGDPYWSLVSKDSFQQFAVMSSAIALFLGFNQGGDEHQAAEGETNVA